MDFVLKNIPSTYSEELIKDYVEGLFDIGVHKVRLIDGLALVTVIQKITDLKKAKLEVHEVTLENKQISLIEVSTRVLDALVIYNIDLSHFSEKLLHSFFQTKFGITKENITECKTWPHKRISFLRFTKQTDLSTILRTDDYVPLPSEDYHIQVGPYYAEFHDVLNKQWSSGSQDISHSTDDGSDSESSVELEGNQKADNSHDSKGNVKESPKVTYESDSESKNGSDSSVKLKDKKKLNAKVESDSDSDSDSESDSSVKLKDKKKRNAKVENDSDSDSDSDSESDSSVKLKDKKKLNAKVENDSDSDSDSDSESDSSVKSKDKKKLNAKVESDSDSDCDSDSESDSSVKLKDKKKLNAKVESDSECDSESNQKADNSHDSSQDNFTSDSDSDNSGQSKGNQKADNCCGFLNNNKEIQTVTSDSDSECSSESEHSNDNGTRDSNSKDKSRSTNDVSGESNSSDSEEYHSCRESNESYVSCTRNEYDRHDSNIDDMSSSDVSGNEDEEIRANTKTKTSSNEDSTAYGGLEVIIKKKYFSKQCEQRKRLYDSNSFKNTTVMPKHSVINIKKKFSKQSSNMSVTINKSDVKKTGVTGFEQLENKQTTAEVKLDSVVMLHFIEKSFGNFKKCTVTFDNKKNAVIFKGMQDAVTNHKIKILEKIRSIKFKNIQVEILLNPRAKECIENFLKSRRVHVSFNDTVLTMASKTEDILYPTIKDMTTEFNNIKQFLSPVPIALEKLVNLKADLEIKYLVIVKWIDQRTEIHLISCRQHLVEAENEINNFLKSVDVVEKIFSYEGIKAKYVLKDKSKKLDKMLKEVEILERSEWEDRLTVKFKGNCSLVNKVYYNLCEYFNNIEHKVFYLTSMYTKREELTLVVLGLNTGCVKQMIQDMEKFEKCMIQLNIPSNQCIKPSVFNLGTMAKVFQSNNSVVTIKVGYLTKEKSDIIVRFLNKTDKSFDKRKSLFHHEVMLDEDMTDDIQVFMNTDTLSPNVRAECCVLVGQHDQSSLSSRIDYIINGILQEALSLGASTISISSKTLNNLFNSSTADTSKHLITALHLFLETNTCFKKVNVVVNKDAFDKYITIASIILTCTDCTKDDDDLAVEGQRTKIITNGYLDLDICDTHDVTIDICFVNGKGSEILTSKLNKLIENECLYTIKMTNEAMDAWPLDFIMAVEEKAKGLNVYVEMTNGNDLVSYTIKGIKQSVELLEDFFKKEMIMLIKKWPKHCITSSNAPLRQSLEFLSHASRVNETCPSYWKFYKDKTFWDSINIFKKKNEILVKVDEKIKNAITELFLATWRKGKVGIGRDATGLKKNTTVKVLDVQRIENHIQFQKYSTERKTLFEKMSKKRNVCESPRIPIETTRRLQDFMKEELYTEVNEHYLFHGTKPDYIAIISEYGLDPKLCTQGMLGKGIYTAEMSTKSDQYTDSKPDGEQRSAEGTKLVMVLARVLLGNIYTITKDHPNLMEDAPRLRRPPCKDCQIDNCTDTSHEHCDSVMLEGAGCLFREFVVYDSTRCYPEYVITYIRVAP